MKFFKQLFCKHEYSRMDGLMGMFCKVQCSKCDKINNDFTDAVATTFGPYNITLGFTDKK